MICPEFPPDAIGGGAEVFLALSRHLPAHGVELDVVFGSFRGGSRQWSEAGVHYTEIPLVPTPAMTPYLKTALMPTRTGRRRLVTLISSGAYDVAHLHGISFMMIDFSAHVLKRNGVSWVFTLHGAPRTPNRFGWLGRAAYETYLRCYGSFVIREAAVRTAVSAEAARFPAIADYATDYHVIPNGVDPAAFSRALPEQPISGWPGGARKVVLSIGRIDYLKGFDIGLRALSMLPDSEYVYVILGGDYGELSPLLRLAKRLGVAHRFLPLGHATLEQRRFAMKRSCVVWMPSRAESFGLVALEAMACGLPVVTSGVEGLGEVFAGDLSGSLMRSPDDAEGLASKTMALVADESWRQRVINAGHDRIRRFDWDEIAGEYAACYRIAMGA